MHKWDVAAKLYRRVQTDSGITCFVKTEISTDVECDHLLVEHVHQSSGCRDEDVNASTDNLECFGARDSSDGQARTDLSEALGFDV